MSMTMKEHMEMMEKIRQNKFEPKTKTVKVRKRTSKVKNV